MSVPYNLKTINIDLPDVLRRYLEEKLDSLEHLANPADPAFLCSVELGRETAHHKGGDIFRAEVNMIVGGKQFRASATKESLEAAVDAVKDELKHELGRFKDRNTSLLRRGGAKLKNLLRFGRRTS